MHNQKSLITFNNLNLSFDREILNAVSGSVLQGDHIGLIGVNGTGKSTLLKAIKNNAGNEVKVVYVSQLDFDEYRSEELVYQYLSRITEEWWEIFSKIEEIFQTKISEDSKLSCLSGGELMKLKICIALHQNPDVLLLDEPTNHLDKKSMNFLSNYLIKENLTFIVVSHDINFLNSTVNKIWELKSGNLKVFGGDYDFYLEEKRKTEESIARKYESAQKELSKAKNSLHKENIKFQKAQSKLTRAAKSNDRSMPKIVRNALKLSGQVKHGAAKSKLEQGVAEHESEMKQFSQQKRKKIFIEFKSSNRKGLLVNITNGFLKLQDKVLLENINFSLYGNDRVSISGDNGSGKTTFIKNLPYAHSSQIVGEVTYGKEFKTLFVNQKYDVVNLELTPIENVKQVTSEMEDELIIKALSSVGFSSNQIKYSKAASLSGGEVAKLAFVLATVSQSDLVILDEPTNNLDIETKERLSELLLQYEGAIVVVSHDVDFLEKIDVRYSYEILNKQLVRIS